MLQKLKDTAKHTFIYSLGNLSTKIIGLILLPLYTARLSLLNYGQFAILEVTSMFLVLVCGLRIVSSMLRWCSEEADERKRKIIIFISWTTLIITVLLLNFILMPLRKNLSFLYFRSYDYLDYFTIILVSVSFEILNTIPMNLFRLNGKSIHYVFAFSGKLLLILFLNIYFLTVMEIGVLGIFLSQLIGNFILFLITIPIVIKNIVPKFDFSLFREMIKYSFPLIFSAISVQLLTIGDRFIIKYFLDYTQVGIYSLAYKIAGVVNVFIIQSFALSFLPIAYKMFNSPDAKLFYRKIFKYFSMILIFSALGISFFSREILYIFARNQEFWIAYKLVPILVLTFVFKGIQYVFSLGFHYVKKTKYHAFIVMLGVILNFSLNFLLIPIWQIWGAALATLISAVFITVLFYIFSLKFYFIQYEIFKVFIVLIVGISFYLLSLLVNRFEIYTAIIIKLFLVLIFPIILYFLKFYEKTELDKIKKFWLRLKLIFHLR